jgi:hypothetical protein
MSDGGHVTGAALAQSLGGARAFMDAEVVQDDDVAAFERRRELGLDVEIEGDAIHRSVHNPGRDQPIAPEPGDESLSSPAPERRFGSEPLAAQTAAAQAHQVGGDCRFVDEHQPRGGKTHARLAFLDPDAPSLSDVGALALGRHQRFFYMSIPPCRACATARRERL